MAKKKGGGQPQQQGSRKGKRTEKDAARTKLRKLRRCVKGGQFAQARVVLKKYSIELRKHFASDVKAIEKAIPEPKPKQPVAAS